MIVTLNKECSLFPVSPGRVHASMLNFSTYHSTLKLYLPPFWGGYPVYSYLFDV